MKLQPDCRTIAVALVSLFLLSQYAEASSVRFATYNASMYRKEAGGLIKDLQKTDCPQIQAVAEIVQRVRPDVLFLNEFDYDTQGVNSTCLAIELFQKNYLSVGQNGAKPITYPYVYYAPVNAGEPSGLDLNNNGKLGDPGDAFGFGHFEGQFGMVVFSKYPIVKDKVRTFQNFLWKDMPNSLLLKDWYSPEEQKGFRLSSKSHWDIPISISGQPIHALVGHPTPPVFDGPENCNGKRNHDEIRFFADYINPDQSGYIYDDKKVRGGLTPNTSFVIMGDFNADPKDGDSIPGAVNQLLENSYINVSVVPSSKGAVEAAKLQGGVNDAHRTDPSHDTGDWSDKKGRCGNIRLDYVLPSKNLKILDAQVFWPTSKDPLYRLVGNGSRVISSDHRMVWIDVELESTN